MNFRLIVISSMVFVAGLYSTRAQQSGVLRFDVVRSDLSIPGKEAIQVRVDFNPGVTALTHTHPGEEIAFVLEGTIEYKLHGRDAVILKAGQALFIPSGIPHSARNVGNGKASELATYIVDKDAPLVELVK